LIRRVLTQAGYVALEASSAAAAESVARSYSGRIELVILDLVMPGGGGLDFANALEVILPGTKVLYISGAADSIVVHSIQGCNPELMIMKPFNISQLLERVARVLERKHG
jgi:DNA-binding response OmpR family regulator